MPNVKVEVPKSIKLTGPNGYEQSVDLPSVHQSVIADCIQKGIQRLLDSRIDKSKKDEPEAWKAKAVEIMPEFMDDLENGTLSGAGRKADPVEAKLRDMADRVVRQRIKAAGKKVSDFDSKSLTALRQKVLDAKRPEWEPLAKEQVRQEAELAKGSDLDLDI